MRKNRVAVFWLMLILCLTGCQKNAKLESDEFTWIKKEGSRHYKGRASGADRVEAVS